MGKDWIEIGSGEDGHYHWIPEFSNLEEIDLILNEFESVGGLGVVKRQTSYWKNSKTDPDLMTLIEPFVSIDTEFHDPDQPNASIWGTVFLKRAQKKEFQKIIDAALHTLQELRDQHLAKGTKPPRPKSSATIDLKQPSRPQEKVVVAVSQILSHLKSGVTDLACFGNFLVSAHQKQIYYLERHERYRGEDSDEAVIATELGRDYEVIRAYESSQPEDPWIAHFAGARRLKVMGWHQTHSRLHYPNPSIQELLYSVRERFNASDE
jgi:hypothetical protein